MNNKAKNMLINAFNVVKPSLIAIGIGLLLGFIVMLIFNPAQAFPGFMKMLMGGFTIGMKGIGDVLLKATPIILTGVSLVVAFKTGLFNIGASGQMIVGGYVAVHVGVLWELPGGLHWIIALILGAIAGSVWGMIPGLLKAFTNTNEVVSSIMMNYIGTYLVIYLVKENVYNVAYAKSRDILSTAQLPGFGNLFGNSTVNIGLIIAIIVAILVYFLFKKTTLGYELKSSGFNAHASKYAGMNAKRNIVISMAIAGAISGLAGAIMYLVPGTNIATTATLLPEGFDGISVALLGLGEPLGALSAGIFLSHIRQGGFYMQVNGYPPQIIDIIIAVVVYTTSISVGLQVIIKKIKQNRLENKLINKEENI